MSPRLAESSAGLGTRILRGALWVLDFLVSMLLNLTLAKTISIFVSLNRRCLAGARSREIP